MEAVNIPGMPGKKMTEEDIHRYHEAINSEDITAYIADAELIFRDAVPLGSSFFENIAKSAGRKGEYLRLGKYEETAAFLDSLRAQTRREGLDSFPGLREYLSSFGLTSIPNPGFKLPKTVLTYTTKYDLAGDTDIDEKEVMRRSGLTGEQFKDLQEKVMACSGLQIRLCRKSGIVDNDGKMEAGVVHKEIRFGDSTCNTDENRLGILYEDKSGAYVLSANKEIVRAVARIRGLYTAREDAKERYHKEWKHHFEEFMKPEEVKDIQREGYQKLGNAMKHVANLFLGQTVFDAAPIGQWAPALIPYSSRVQPDQLSLFK